MQHIIIIAKKLYHKKEIVYIIFLENIFYCFYFFLFDRQTASCSASFGCVWSFGSLTTLRSFYKWTLRAFCRF